MDVVFGVLLGWFFIPMVFAPRIHAKILVERFEIKVIRTMTANAKSALKNPSIFVYM